MMSYMRIRYAPTNTAYPENVVRVMRPQLLNLWLAVKSHYARRNNGPEYRRAVRNWISELKRIDAGAGYAAALAAVNTKLGV